MDIQQGDMFAFTHGKFLGKFLVYIDRSFQSYRFLMLPGEFKVVEMTEVELLTLQKPNEMGRRYLDLAGHLDEKVIPTIVAQFHDTIKNKRSIIKGGTWV